MDSSFDFKGETAHNRERVLRQERRMDRVRNPRKQENAFGL